MGYYLISASTLVFVSVLQWIIWRVIYSIWWKPKQIEKFFKDQGIVGPPYRLLHGNLKDNASLIKEARSKPMELSHKILPRVAPFLQQTVEKYGKVCLTWNGLQPRVIILDPEMIKEILSTKFDHFRKPNSNPVTKLLVTGLVDYEGEKWAKHRKILNPAFHIEKIKGMLPAFHTSCMELISQWGDKVDTRGSCEVDVWPDFQRLTGDVISRAAFGSNYSEGRSIFQLQYELVELVSKALTLPYFPGLEFLPTKENLRRKKIDNEISSLISIIIEKKEKARESKEISQNDLLGLLLDSNSKEFQDGGSFKSISTEDVMKECKLFYFAGQETTSILLTWTMVLLSMHPVWQNRARDEVIQIFGKSKPDFDGLSHLKIVTMILHEVLRLYPPVINLVRTAYKEINVGNATIPPGVELALPALFLHHDKELWGDDAEEFSPERFISGGHAKAAKSQASFIPFGWGPRTCLGQNFALIEAKLALSLILQKFWFELSPCYAHAPGGLTLRPQYGAQIILHKLSYT